MAKASQTTIDKLVPDNINANKGTEYGQHLIEKSLRELGAGRSILLDKNNRIIAGNKTIENAAAIGLENVIIIETTGDQIVAVKRTDIDLDSDKGRSLALADNATSKANLEWDQENIKVIAEKWDVEPEEWGIAGFKEEDEREEDEDRYTKKVQSPIYEPSEEIPSTSVLVDTAKTMQLLKEIEASNLPKEEKEFLSLAAQRHLVFNYSKVADYYAHASKEMQSLMEKSALVIIDMDQAIENGFMKISQQLIEQYEEDYQDDAQ